MRINVKKSLQEDGKKIKSYVFTIYNFYLVLLCNEIQEMTEKRHVARTGKINKI
jgi:hypothetical protein